MQALTDAVYKPVTVRIEFDRPSARGRLEAFNGRICGVRLQGASGAGTSRVDGTWGVASTVIEGEVRYAVDPLDARYDRTIVTVRDEARPFSFAADEVARGDRILVEDLGVLVTRADDPITLAEYRAQRKELGRKTIYQRVFDETEQTLPRAWNDMPLKRPLYFVHGLPGNRNTMRQLPNGEVFIGANPLWFKNPTSARDSERKKWHGDWLRLGFGFAPEGTPAGRELREGYLPELRMWWQRGPVQIEVRSVLDALSGDLSRTPPLDEPTVLLMRVRFVNTSADETGTAQLRFSSVAQDQPETVRVAGDQVLADYEGQARLRALVATGGRGAFQQDGVALDRPEEVEALRKTDIAARLEAVCAFWRELTARGTQITTPEPWLNGFYRAHVRHLLVNCAQELGSDRLHAHVGSFYYGVFPNESVMMISDLDRRGLADDARRCYDSFLHYQGSVPLIGDFSSAEGEFYGSGGQEMGSYNKSHGYVLWGLAEHWRYTHDRQWMERVAPSIVKGCEWIIRERHRTMVDNPDGTRPVAYGWLPKGGLEDVTDFWHWMATNAATTWGFSAVADALAEAGQPRGAELQREAAAYREDFLRGVTESRIRAAVVRLRDGTYVPKIPAHPQLRGRAVGWIRETLEGSIFLPAYQLIDPRGPETTWILQDYEDNLYISDTYGYSIPALDSFWFSRGGFSMQSNLLDGPLPYLYRDEIKHYLRAFFNGVASALYPDIAMCNEHCLPELGYPAGDHFKSSDEAQVTYWLRLMFVREQGRELYLGQALPRYWLKEGQTVSIVRAASHFGPLDFAVESHAANGEIRATVVPPERNRPEKIYVRLRHPEAKRLQSVTVNGAAWTEFDAEKEWVVLPGSVQGRQEIVGRY